MQSKLCMCGCGQVVDKKKFIRGHGKIWACNWSKLCECGCGNITKPGSRFISGHNNVGTHHTVSIETRRKISKALVGRPGHNLGSHFSEESRQKMREAHTGIKQAPRTAEACANISKSKMGHTVSDNTKRKISISKSGENNTVYVDGAGCWDSSLHPFLRLYEYKKLQQIVKNRDKECANCHAKKHIGYLCTHHVVPVDVGYESALCDDPSNLVLLCGRCHAKVHRKKPSVVSKARWKKFLPFAKEYLSHFGYTKLLLDNYI